MLDPWRRTRCNSCARTPSRAGAVVDKEVAVHAARQWTKAGALPQRPAKAQRRARALAETGKSDLVFPGHVEQETVPSDDDALVVADRLNRRGRDAEKLRVVVVVVIQLLENVAAGLLETLVEFLAERRRLRGSAGSEHRRRGRALRRALRRRQRRSTRDGDASAPGNTQGLGPAGRGGPWSPSHKR